MKQLRNQAANILTVLRIVFSLALIFVTTLDVIFFIIYSMCGVTDILDGAVARKLGTASKFGALLDSIADIVFAAAYAFRFIPIFYSHFTGWLLYMLIATLAVKLITIAMGFVKFKKPCFLHNYLSKAAGAVIFLLPPLYFMLTSSDILLGIACAVALLAAADELLCIVKMKEYNADVNGIWRLG